MTKIQEWKISLENDEEAVKGGILIEISQALRRKDKNVFSNMDDFEWIWKIALGLFLLVLSKFNLFLQRMQFIRIVMYFLLLSMFWLNFRIGKAMSFFLV